MSIVRSVGRNTVASLAARMAVLAVWFALTPSLLATLGPDRFGFWSLLLALGGSVASLDLGLAVALSRFVAEAEGRGDASAARRTIVSAVRLQLLLALGFALVGALLRGPLVRLFHVPPEWAGEAERALVVTLVGFALGVPGTLFASALQGLQRMDLFAAANLPLAIGLAFAIHAALETRTPLLAVVASQALYNVCLTLVVGVVLARELARVRRPAAEAAQAADPAGLPRLLRFGLWVQVNAALAFVSANLDKFLIGSLVALAPVAAYEVGARVSGVAFLLPLLLLSALLPAVARRNAATPGAHGLVFYRRASYPYLVLVGFLVAALLGLARPLLELWLGSAQPAQVFMLRGLALAGGLSAATGIASTLVRAGDRLALETQYAIAGFLAHVVFSIVGIRLWGWPGAIYGLVASSLLGALFFVFRVESWLGARPLAEAWSIARAPLLAAAGSAAAAAWIGSLALFGAPGRGHGLVALAASAAALMITFALLLVLLSPRRWRELLRPFALARPTL